MSNEITQGLPYSDDFDPSKKFTQILALPGRVHQAREFTQSQTLMLHFLKKLGNTILKDGSVVSGMGFVFNGNDKLTITSGEVYMDGIIHDFSEQTLTVTKMGKEVVGLVLNKTVITEEQDPSLRDPAQGFANYSQPGAHRVKAEVKAVVNDPSAIVLYTFIDGTLQSNVAVQSDLFSDLLAKRTYDESGNYKVSGLNMWSREYDANHVQLVVESGRAYVQGYEVHRPSPAQLLIPKALTTRPVSNEPKTYQSSVDRYMLNNKFVKQINNVVASVEVTATITRGNVTGGSDSLPKTPVMSIVSVKAGSTTYVQGVDYQLSGDRIDWSLSGAEPSVGSSYSVVWRYNKTMVSGVDYELTTEPNGNSYLDFSLQGDNPVSGSTMFTDYDFLLARFDRVYVDKYGNIKTVQGQSDLPELVAPPLDSDPYRLSLGTIKLLPGSGETEVFSETITRISMADIHSLMNRLDNMEYNQALSDLDSEAMAGESPTTLKGIFTDGFIGFSKTDTNHPDFGASLDIFKKELMLGGTQKVVKPTLKPSSTAKLFGGRTYTLAHGEEVIASQLWATNTMNVNPYSAFNKSGFLKISPERDSWVDVDNKVVLTTSQSETSEVRYENVWGWWSPSTTNSSSSSSTSSSTVLETAIAFARRIDIEIEATDFPANTDLLEGFIDGVKVNLVATGSTQTGTVPGTVKADASGKVTAKFTIPENIRTGSREIILKNAVSQGSAIFTTSGLLRSVTTNTHTHTTVRRVTTIFRDIDPLAQSFHLPEDRFVTGVDLYFATKSATDNVTVQIRGMFNGYPTNEVYAETVLNPSQVNVSANASVPTRVTFDIPAYCERETQYAVTILTTSSEYNMHIATLGNKMVDSNSFATSQPYTAGVLFSSSNAITWSAHQDSDLKFGIVGAVFAPQSVIEFETVNSLDADVIILDSKYETPSGTSLVWEYRTSSNGNWFPIDALTARNLPNIATSISLRATLSTTNPKLSPMVSADDLAFIAVTSRMSGSYISKLVETPQQYTTVRQVIEAYVPSGTTAVPKLSTNDGTWVSGTLVSSEVVDKDFSRYEYQYTIPSSGVSNKFRARVDLTTSNRLIRPVVRKLMNIIK